MVKRRASWKGILRVVTDANEVWTTAGAATFYGPDKRLHDRTLCMVARQGDQEVYSHYDVHSLYGWSETIVTHR